MNGSLIGRLLALFGWPAPPDLPLGRCFDCGGEIAPVLLGLGSLRCHDCRDYLA